MKRVLALLLFLIPISASATTTVVGQIQNLGTGGVGSNTFVRFWLRGCGGNQPRVDGTALIGPTQGGVFYFDIAAGPTGAINGTLYSTRNAAGTGAGDIECGGSKIAVWYGMQVFVAGKGGPETPIHADSGVTLDITTVQPIVNVPPPAIPGAGIVGPQGPAGPQGPQGIPGGGNILPTDNTFTNNNRFAGPDPIIDVTAFGARAVSPAPSTTATINATNTVATLASGTGFQNGDGITIYGAGLTNTLTTPTAPTVTNVISAAGTSTNVNVAAPAGATQYSYKCVARDQFGALTAASPATTTNTGQATLGQQTATISTYSLSNDTLTVNLTTTPALAAGMLVQLTGTGSADFAGWYTVATVGSGTFTINNFPIDSRANGWSYKQTNSGTQGTVTFFYSNHIVCPYQANATIYYVYGGPGAATFNFIGQTKYNGSLWRETWVDDYGSTYMANQQLPPYVPSTAPSVATNDPLTTTILSGGGTNTITLANPAINSVTNATALFDNGPAFVAASKSTPGGATMLIPYCCGNTPYIINSYTQLAAFINVQQVENITVNETLEVDATTNWHGDWGAQAVTGFGTAGHPTITVTGANPGIYANGQGVNFYNIQMNNGATNGGNDILFDLPYNNETDQSVFVTGGGGLAGDYLSMPVVVHAYGGGGNPMNFYRTIFSSGPTSNQVSWTPIVHFPINQDGAGNNVGSGYFVRCTVCFLNRRGFEMDDAGGQGFFYFTTIYRQGGITPLLSVSGNGAVGITLDNIQQDTEASGTVASWNSAQPIIEARNILNNSVEPGTDGVPPPFTGRRPFVVRNFGGAIGNLPNRQSDNCGYSNFFRTNPYTLTLTQEFQCKIFMPMSFPGGHPLYWDINAPVVTAGAASNGGTLNANTTYYYLVTSVGADGGESTSSQNPPASSTTSTTNKTIGLTWTSVVGASGGYKVYRCTGPAGNCITASGGGNSAFNLIGSTTALSLSDTGLGTGVFMPKATGTGSSGINPSQLWGNAFVLNSTAGAFAHTLTSLATANRAVTLPDIAGSVGVIGSGVTPVNGDCVTFSVAGGVSSLADTACIGGGTVTHTGGALTLNLPVFGNGSADVKVGTVTGNTTKVATFTGAATAGRCVDTDANGNLQVVALDCNAGAGSGTVTHTVGALTANLPVIGNGAADVQVGTATGNTTEFATFTGAATAAKCVDIDAAGNLKATGLDCNGTGTTFESIYLADQQAGADWCAKIMTADAALGGTAGEIWMNQAAGTSACAANITLSANHKVRFIQGGTYSLGTHSVTFTSGSGFVTNFSSSGAVGQVTITFTGASGTAFISNNQASTINAVEVGGFLLNCTGGAANTAVGLDSSGWSNSYGHDMSIDNCGTEHLMDTAAGGSTVYDTWERMSYIAGSASSGFNGIVMKHSSNAQHWVSARFSRLAVQMTIGGTAPSTDQVDCFGCTFELADTEAIHIVNAFGVNFAGVTRFENMPLGVLVDAVASNQIRIQQPYWATITTQVTDNSGGSGYTQGLGFIGTTPVNSGHGVQLQTTGSGSAVTTSLADTGLTASGTVASGTAVLSTSAIASATCATAVTVSATGVLSTDNIQADFNSDPTGVTGYAPSASGILTIIKYPTTNNVNFKVCNSTGVSITPGAITLNWRVMR